MSDHPDSALPSLPLPSLPSATQSSLPSPSKTPFEFTDNSSDGMLLRSLLSSNRSEESEQLLRTDNIFICDVTDCYQVFKDGLELRIHRLYHQSSQTTEEEPHYCDIIGCNKRKEEFDYHKQSDREFEPKSSRRSFMFTCDFQGCFRSFKSELGVQLHKEQCHRGGRPLECLFKDCHKVFKYRRSHRTHVEKHFGQIN